MKKTSHERKKLYIIAFGLNLIYLVGLFIFLRGSWEAHAWTDLFWLGTGIWATVASANAWKKTSDARTRRGWLYFLLANTLWTIGIAIWSWQELVTHRYSPSPGLSDIGPIGFGIFSLLAIIALFKPEQRENTTISAAFEFAVSFGILLITSTLLLYIPLSTLDIPTKTIVSPILNSITYSVAVMLGNFFLSQGKPRTSWRASVYILVALGLNLGAHFAYVYAHLLNKYEVGLMIDSLWVLSFTIFAVAASEETAFHSRPHRRSYEQLVNPNGRFISATYWAFFLGALALGLWSYSELVPRVVLIFYSFSFVLIVFITTYLELNWIRETRRRQEVEKALKILDEFLTVASHELRTPLTPLAGNLLLLETMERQGSLTAKDPAELRQTLLRSRRQIDSLIRLTEGMLDVLRLSRGDLALRRSNCDLVAITKKTAARFKDELDRAKCDLTFDLPPSTKGEWDENRVEQAMEKLIENAIKFGAGHPIEIRLKDDADRATLAIIDHGIGIDPADQAKIFEQFGRGVSANHYPGLGFGLYLAKKIADAHGGSLEVESALGKGAQFTLELPR